mgnify:CR=1 FL=1
MEENDCLICFEDLDSKDKAILSCKHVVHYSCLQQWIKKRKNVTQICPLCNNDGEIINIIDAKPIYNEEFTQCINLSYQNNLFNPNNNQIENPNNNQTNQNNNQNQNIPKTSVVKNLMFGCCNIL